LVVQQVANVLASLYLEENIRVVDLQTTSTSKFLEDEMKDVQGQLVEIREKDCCLQRKESAFPSRTIPVQSSKPWISTDRNYEQFNDQLRTLKEKETI